MSLLEVRGLKVYFPVQQGVLRRSTSYIKAVDDVDLTIEPGEVVGIAGESGSGKTTVGRAILRLIEPTAGQVLIEGRDLAALGEEELRRAREAMQIVFQNPFAALDPRMNVRKLILEPLEIHQIGDEASREKRLRELLQLVGLQEEHLDRYPHEFSGGQRQRIGIARALALNPKLLILDEPTSALDVSVQATILNLLLKLRDELGLSYLFISHDLNVLRYVCDRIGIMYLGRIVELAPTHEIFEDPKHPYTISLLSAAPEAKIEQKRGEIILQGEVSQRAIGQGCRFSPRCPAAQIDLCKAEEPALDEVWRGHRAACHLALQNLPLGIITASGEPYANTVRRQKHMRGYRIATDIGGTFTDLVVLNEETGEITVAKASTTPQDFSQGILDTINKSDRLDTARTTFFVHGTTVVINALTERKGVKTGLITTRGFRDVLEIQRSNRPDIYNLAYSKPKPFVERSLRLEVSERLNYKGDILTPLDREEMRQAVAQLVKEGVESIAVCFLHAYINPNHELEAGEIIRQTAPRLPFTLSHQVTGEWREYERTSTAVFNSYILPTAQKYLDNLETQLTNQKRMGDVLHIMQSNGGSATFALAKRTPINLVESGPVAGVIGSARIGDLIGEPNVIAFDVGGTTAKTSLIEGGQPKITTEYKIEHTREFAGYPILVPTIDIVEIGSGGGSIAYVDDAGALRVGPISAGAVPGPACYDQGGTQPTVTDANLVVGRLNARNFLGGELKVSLEKARQAIKPIAERFNTSIEEAALGIIRISDFGKMNAIKLISVRRGYDPRDFVLVAFGGGGPMHAGAMMRELRCKKVVIPVYPGVFSAFGMLMSDLQIDTLRTRIMRVDGADLTAITGLYDEMEAQSRHNLEAENIARESIRIQRHADMRYLGQEHTVKVPVPNGALTPAAMEKVSVAFHDLHEQAFTFRLDSPLEMVSYHVTAIGMVNKAEIKPIKADGASLGRARKETRAVYFEGVGAVQTAIYERDQLPIGKPIPGPAVIEEASSATVVYPDQQFYRDKYGFLHVEAAGSGSSKQRFGFLG
ncbi:MAG: ATP-binding cassette domain-containing protein [Chloroflexi bacterium]|uniref:oligopeptide/dipeptide ABC transporter ATP-binding protein n=1 Tax=Candidatus Flexifilum breve TaxID=3140694 RepID=UPI00313691E6|nr:ATP-binding cassette domain-containing protein [Chloroflexota bacterium]